MVLLLWRFFSFERPIVILGESDGSGDDDLGYSQKPKSRKARGRKRKDNEISSEFDDVHEDESFSSTIVWEQEASKRSKDESCDSIYTHKYTGAAPTIAKYSHQHIQPAKLESNQSILGRALANAPIEYVNIFSLCPSYILCVFIIVCMYAVFACLCIYFEGK